MATSLDSRCSRLIRACRIIRGCAALLIVGCMPLAALQAQDEQPRQRESAESQEAEGEDPFFDGERDARFRDADRGRNIGRDRERAGQGDANATRVVPFPGRPGSERWRLGVYADPADVGYRVNGVLSGSPAARVGLEPGDIIVAVDGYQVGRVGRQFYPLSRELQARASGDGEVVLLVRNVRNGRLLNLDVDFRRNRPRVPYFRNRLFDEAPRAAEGREAEGAEPVEEGADVRGRSTGELQ